MEQFKGGFIENGLIGRQISWTRRGVKLSANFASFKAQQLTRTVERVIRIDRQAVETYVAAIAARLDRPLRRPMARLA